MALEFAVLDVFTSKPFRGNPLAIVRVPSEVELSQAQKQAIAKEFNLSETVFLHQQTETDVQNGEARVDIFTPIAELPFAGHPTVGTSNYILHHLKLETARTLVAKAGRLPFQAQGDGVLLSVPHNVHIHTQPFSDRDFGHYPVVSIVKGMNFILAQLPDLEALARPTENLLGTSNTYTAKERLDEGWRDGIVNTYYFVDLGTQEDGTRRLRTRGLGSREDPATGSAASALSSYLTLSEGKGGPLTRSYHITQGVEMGRRGDIHVKVILEENRREIKEVFLGGEAVPTSEGKIQIPSL